MGLFSIVGRVTLPDNLKQFPIFRKTNKYRGDDTLWFFWDGQREWSERRPLTDDELDFPVGPSFPSAPVLLEAIQDGRRHV